ncbi:hypothetical protein ACIRD9_32295 [Streptomyces violaceus]|uniref:hypothetical protein n=1 Tax=Streptomyces violaceus TaxID=1936 RepID=UPI00380C5C70
MTVTDDRIAMADANTQRLDPAAAAAEAVPSQGVRHLSLAGGVAEGSAKNFQIVITAMT